MSTNKHTLSVYWGQTKKHFLTFWVSLILIPLSALALSTFLPYFLSLAIADIATASSANLTQHLVWAGAVGFIGVVANFIGFRALIRHEGRVRTGLYTSVFSRLLNKDLRFFVNEKLGALTSRYIDFNRSHIALQDLLIVRTLGFVVSVVSGLIIVALSAPLVSLILFVLLCLVVLQVKIFTSIRAPYRHERKQLIGEIHGEAADSLTNSLLVKTFAQEKFENKKLKKQMKRFEAIYIKDISLFGVDGSIRNTIMVITQIIGIAICAVLVTNGELELAIAIFFLTYLQRISTQIFALGELLNGYDEALLQAAPMSDILDRPTTVNDEPNAPALHMTTPRIDFKNVSYAYDDANDAVLENINLSIPAGQKIGLIGHSGAGKTTITHLLLRFSDVTDGEISISNQGIRSVTQQSLRENIAYVSQEPMLFHRTLKENIAYGADDPSEDAIIKAAKQANAYEFISALPKGFDTLVGERGVKLSGGQRQRVAIARAILKDAPILVLDEATSALDSESEKLIQEALQKLMKGRTSIVIAHRLSTIAKLDRIIVLESGTIAEDGTHQELLQKQGTYAKLWAHQSGGFIEE